jgi:hypothetical protein
MSEATLYYALKSVDENARTVTGRATRAEVDRSGEILDYWGSKPYWEAWRDETLAASKGLSMGALRVMHRDDIAAGVVTRMDFLDAEEAVDIEVKVTDPLEWEKVTSGTYTGFSQRGPYISKTPDTSLPRFRGMVVNRVVIAPREVSLVDRPCVPSATFFEVKKCDGTTENRSFKGGDMDENEKPVEGEAKKGLWEAKRFLDLLEDARWLQVMLADEKIREGDASVVPEDLKTCVGMLADQVEAYIGEQLTELKAGGVVAEASEAVGAAEEGKADAGNETDAIKAARNGRKAARTALCEAHKAYMGTYGDGEEEDEGGKAEAAVEGEAKKADAPDIDALVAAAVEKALEARKAAPAEDRPRPSVRAVSKEEDSEAKKGADQFDARKAASEAPTPVDAMKTILQNPNAFAIRHN